MDALAKLIQLYSEATGEPATRDTEVNGTPLWKFNNSDGGYQRMINWCEKKIAEKKNKFDYKKVAMAMRLFLEGVGAPMDSVHSMETPERMTKMWQILIDYSIDPNKYVKLFPIPENQINPAGQVMQKDLTFHSFCAHHGLPFYGKAAISYIPGQSLIGLSKIGRILRAFSKRFQVQEELTQQVAEFLMECDLKPKGVAIIIDSSHMCMSQRGVRMHGAQTRTMVGLGEYQTNPEKFDRFERYVNADGGQTFRY